MPPDLGGGGGREWAWGTRAVADRHRAALQELHALESLGTSLDYPLDARSSDGTGDIAAQAERFVRSRELVLRYD